MLPSTFLCAKKECARSLFRTALPTAPVSYGCTHQWWALSVLDWISSFYSDDLWRWNSLTSLSLASCIEECKEWCFYLTLKSCLWKKRKPWSGMLLLTVWISGSTVSRQILVYQQQFVKGWELSSRMSWSLMISILVVHERVIALQQWKW